jgi:hypothetical protein
VNAHPDAQKKCTVYSTADRAVMWNNLTARQRTNADGSETFEAYGATYSAVAAARRTEIQATAEAAIEAEFGGASSTITPAQKAAVIAAVRAETRPAAVLETIYAALDTATNGTAASTQLKAKFGALEMVGGYAAGETLRAADLATVNAMWADVKAFVASHYAGLTVDIAALAPATVLVTTGDATFAGDNGVLTVGLSAATNKATLYSTLLHEAKHMIDFASHAPVQGSAWEGAATLVERMTFPQFFDEKMSSPADQAMIPFYTLGNEIENVRLTATTDATLKVFLRKSCGKGQLNSIDFAKEVVKSYGYTDDATLLLRSRRAHFGAQYLDYDYGLVQYGEVVAYFQQAVGTAKTIDPFVLQACDMSFPAKDAAHVTKLKTCLGIP